MTEWISVKDKLPEPWTEVLIWRGPEYPIVSSEVTPTGLWCHFFNITHWMPLPEPPKEE